MSVCKCFTINTVRQEVTQGWNYVYVSCCFTWDYGLFLFSTRTSRHSSPVEFNLCCKIGKCFFSAMFRNTHRSLQRGQTSQNAIKTRVSSAVKKIHKNIYSHFTPHTTETPATINTQALKQNTLVFIFCICAIFLLPLKRLLLMGSWEKYPDCKKVIHIYYSSLPFPCLPIFV